MLRSFGSNVVAHRRGFIRHDGYILLEPAVKGCLSLSNEEPVEHGARTFGLFLVPLEPIRQKTYWESKMRVWANAR